jgi:hypothetical protein
MNICLQEATMTTRSAEVCQKETLVMHDLNVTQMKHHAAIGGVVLHWTHLENNLQITLWKLAGLDLNLGRCISQHMTFDPIWKAILTLTHETPAYSHFSGELEKQFEECKKLRDKRNDVVHAIWAIFLDPNSTVPQVLNAGAGEVTGLVIKARGRLNFKINRTTVSQIDDITEEIIAFNRKLTDFISKNVKVSPPQDAQPRVSEDSKNQ